MRKYWIVLLIAVLAAAGCASATPNTASFENQKEQIQKLLVGTWEGYVKDNPHNRISYRERSLIIYEVHKESDGWTIKAILNRESPEYVKLYVYNETVTLEMMDRYNGLYVLTPYQGTHLLGSVAYDRGAWRLYEVNEVVLKKISR